MFQQKKSTDVKKIAIGASIAAAAGYIAGVLTAPKSGKQTRRDMKRAAQKGVQSAEAEAKKLQHEAEDLMKEAKSKGADLSDKARKELNELVDKAKIAKDKATTLVVAVKNGEADDKELQRALDQARNALKNVRKYLQK
jgi:gas vesicle protein